MRRLFILLFTFISLVSQAQVLQGPAGYGKQEARFKALDFLGIPYKDTACGLIENLKNGDCTGAIVFRPQDNTVYVKKPGKWEPLANGVLPTTLYSGNGTLAGDRLLEGAQKKLTFNNLNQFTVNSDTSGSYASILFDNNFYQTIMNDPGIRSVIKAYPYGLDFFTQDTTRLTYNSVNIRNERVEMNSILKDSDGNTLNSFQQEIAQDHISFTPVINNVIGTGVTINSDGTVTGSDAVNGSDFTTKQQLERQLHDSLLGMNLQHVTDKGNTTNKPIYTTGNFLDIAGASPFLGFNGGTVQLRSVGGDMYSVISPGRFFKVLNGLSGAELLTIDSNKVILGRPTESQQFSTNVLRNLSGNLDVSAFGGNNIRFYINSSERMRIDLNGNLGLGTTIAASLLELKNNSVIAWNTPSGTAGDGGITVDGSYRLHLINAGNRLTVTQQGYIGIGEINPTSVLTIKGSRADSIAIISSTVTLNVFDNTILCNNTSDITVNLPTASSCKGRVYEIKKISNNGNTVTVDPAASERIDTQSTFVIGTFLQSISVKSDGADWWIF